jgi:release factor glutamine methyltransferase
VNLVEFAGLQLIAVPGVVMTPRPASHALVERALAHIGDREATVVDAGTGSGAIAIAIARSAPRAEVWATDVSEAAVGLARRNAERLGVRVKVRRGDLLDPVPGAIDVVVANLPYLPLGERALHDDLASEPVDAVFAMGDGLDPYRRLVAAAAERLAPDGLLAVQLRGELVAAGAHELELLDHLFAEEERAA